MHIRNSIVERLVVNPMRLLEDEGMPDEFMDVAQAGIMWRALQGQPAIENLYLIRSMYDEGQNVTHWVPIDFPFSSSSG